MTVYVCVVQIIKVAEVNNGNATLIEGLDYLWHTAHKLYHVGGHVGALHTNYAT